MLIGSVSEVMAITMTGLSAGLTLRSVGGLGRLLGNCPVAALIADCTSWAAASMFRSRSNCRVMLVEASVLLEVICETPEISESCLSRGVATFDAMVSGLAPGRTALIWMVGASTWGSEAT